MKNYRNLLLLVILSFVRNLSADQTDLFPESSEILKQQPDSFALHVRKEAALNDQNNNDAYQAPWRGAATFFLGLGVGCFSLKHLSPQATQSGAFFSALDATTDLFGQSVPLFGTLAGSCLTLAGLYTLYQDFWPRHQQKP